MSVQPLAPVDAQAEELFTRLRALVLDRTLERDPLNVLTALCMNKCVRIHNIFVLPLLGPGLAPAPRNLQSSSSSPFIGRL